PAPLHATERPPSSARRMIGSRRAAMVIPLLYSAIQARTSLSIASLLLDAGFGEIGRHGQPADSLQPAICFLDRASADAAPALEELWPRNPKTGQRKRKSRTKQRRAARPGANCSKSETFLPCPRCWVWKPRRLVRSRPDPISTNPLVWNR